MSVPAMPRMNFADGHFADRVWDGVITVLAWLWRPLRWLATIGVVLLLLALIVLWLAHAVELPLPDARTVPVLRDIVRHAGQIELAAVAVLILLPLAWWSHGARAQTRAADDPSPQYDLQHARWLEPDDFIPRYIPGVYHWRHADRQGQQPDESARAALRAARGRWRGSPHGVLVVGRPLQGKTRLAWEAVQATMPGWTLVRWVHSSTRPFDMDAVRGHRVVLWLDDLDTYANAAEAPTLLDLPRLFKQAHVRLVIAATCTEGASETLVRAQLGPLLDRLRVVRLDDIGGDEADALGRDLARVNIHVRRAAFDGTPGSLVLDIAGMRDKAYAALPESARRVLRALKLMRSAGITACSERRVRAVAETAFGLPMDPRAWPYARAALVKSGFVRLTQARVSRARGVEPVAEVYLDQAVPDYPALGRRLVDDWPRLRAALTARQDAPGLFSLGNQYRERASGDRMENLQRAEVCYWETLRICTPRKAPLTWAGAQSNLGITLAAEAQMVNGPERIQMLAVAARAYREALAMYRRLRIWENWARTQTNLGLALREQAGLVEGQRRADLLREAASTFRTVTHGRRREVAPTTPLRAQFGLNLIEREHREAVAQIGRLRQLQTTIKRLPALLPRGFSLETLPEHPAAEVPSPAMSHPRHSSLNETYSPTAEPGGLVAEEGFTRRPEMATPRVIIVESYDDAGGDGMGAHATDDERPGQIVIAEEVHTHLEEDDEPADGAE